MRPLVRGLVSLCDGKHGGALSCVNAFDYFIKVAAVINWGNVF